MAAGRVTATSARVRKTLRLVERSKKNFRALLPCRAAQQAVTGGSKAVVREGHAAAVDRGSARSERYQARLFA